MSSKFCTELLAIAVYTSAHTVGEGSGPQTMICNRTYVIRNGRSILLCTRNIGYW